MENSGKEYYAEKIRKFSRVIYVLLQIAFVISIITLVFVGVAAVVSLIPDIMKEIEMNGKMVKAPVLFEIGDTQVVLPFIDVNGDDFNVTINGVKLATADGLFTALIGSIAAMVAIVFAKRVFKLLRVDGSPFGDDVTAALKRLAVALLVLGFVSGAASFMAAAVAWALYLVFCYGRALSEENK